MQPAYLEIETVRDRGEESNLLILSRIPKSRKNQTPADFIFS